MPCQGDTKDRRSIYDNRRRKGGSSIEIKSFRAVGPADTTKHNCKPATSSSDW